MENIELLKLSVDQLEDIFAARLARIFVDQIKDGELDENKDKS